MLLLICYFFSSFIIQPFPAFLRKTRWDHDLIVGPPSEEPREVAGDLPGLLSGPCIRVVSLLWAQTRCQKTMASL